MEFSSCSRLIAESQQIVRYSVRGRLFPILGGRRYIYGCKGTLLHYKSLDLYVMIVGIGALFDTSPTYMSECRKILQVAQSFLRFWKVSRYRNSNFTFKTIDTMDKVVVGLLSFVSLILKGEKNFMVRVA